MNALLESAILLVLASPLMKTIIASNSRACKGKERGKRNEEYGGIRGKKGEC